MLTPAAHSIWALLLLLLPLKTKFIVQPFDGCSKGMPKNCSLESEEHFNTLCRNVSNDDFDSLLHATSCLSQEGQ
jgi:hypothetical protein